MYSVGTYIFMMEIIFHACRHICIWLKTLIFDYKNVRVSRHRPNAEGFTILFFMSVQTFFPIIRVVVTIKIHNPNPNPNTPSSKLQNYKCRKDNRFQYFLVDFKSSLELVLYVCFFRLKINL